MLWFGKKKSEAVAPGSETFKGTTGQLYTVLRNLPMSTQFIAWLRDELSRGYEAAAVAQGFAKDLGERDRKIGELQDTVSLLESRVQNPPCIIFDARTGEPVAIKVLPNCGGEKVKESVKDAGVGIFAFEGKKYNVRAMSKALDELADENNRVHKAFKALQHEHNCLLDRVKGEAEGRLVQPRGVTHEHVYVIGGDAAVKTAELHDRYLRGGGPEAPSMEDRMRLWQYIQGLGVPVDSDTAGLWTLDFGHGEVRVRNHRPVNDYTDGVTVVHYHEINGKGKCKCK